MVSCLAMLLVCVLVAVAVTPAFSYVESLAASGVGILPNDFTGQVAFACDKNSPKLPSMILTPTGWRQDDSLSSCLTNPDDIREYCRKVYPSLNVMNVEPGVDDAEITNWCPIGEKTCEGHTRVVRPFVCMHTPYMSPALVVSRHCKFMHKTAENPSDAKNCFDIKHWETVAENECSKVIGYNKKPLVMQKVGLLMPCDFMAHAGLFAGVEYTCCPVDAATPKPKISMPVKDVYLDLNNPDPLKNSKSNRNYQEYMHIPLVNGKSEHERYISARDGLKNVQHAREHALTETLRSAEEKLLSLMPKEPETARELLEATENRFKKLFGTVEEEEGAESTQLDSVHQLRILHHFKRRLRHLMDLLNDAVIKKNKKDAVRFLPRILRLCVRELTRTANRAGRLSAAKHLPAEELKELRIHSKDIQRNIQNIEAHEGLRALLGVDRIKAEIAGFSDIIKQADKKLSSVKAVVAPGHSVKDRFQALLSLYHQQNEQVMKTYKMQKPAWVDRGHLVHSAVAPGHHKLSAGPLNPLVIVVAVVVALLALTAAVLMAVRHRAVCRVEKKPGYQLTLVEDEKPQDKHLQALMLNGYENPTYKFYEK